MCITCDRELSMDRATAGPRKNLHGLRCNVRESRQSPHALRIPGAEPTAGGERISRYLVKAPDAASFVGTRRPITPQRLGTRPALPLLVKTLAVDIGGTNVKLLAAGEKDPRKFASGPKLTPKSMVAGVKKLAEGWSYDA